MHGIRLSRQAPGSALIVGLTMVVLLAMIALAFSSRMTFNQLRMESDVAGMRAYEMAQTVNALKIQELWSAFKSKPTNERVAWMGGGTVKGKAVAPSAPNYQDSQWVHEKAGDTCTRIKVLSVFQHDWALVRFTTWARVNDEMSGRVVSRKIQRVVRFELGPASAFDYAYFANNYASVSGKKLSIYGSVGANGNVDLNDDPLIDGSIFASVNPDLGALGEVHGSARSQSLSDYKSLGRANASMRPTHPTAEPEDKNQNGKLDPGEDSNANGKLDDFAFAMGYDGTQPVKTMQNQEAMPDFATMDYYRDLAQAYIRPARPDVGESGGATGAIVKQLKAPELDATDPKNYTILINGSYGFNGEPGFTSDDSSGTVTHKNFTNSLDLLNSTKNGNVALIGTPRQPLIILGPVVVSNDLVIKGTIAGQGTFYTGRNTHVVGDLVYRDPPQWYQDDTHFEQTAAINQKKDIVGFGVAGNVVFGDYTNAVTGADQWSTVTRLISPPYTRKQYLGMSQTKGFSLTALIAYLLTTLDGANGYNNALGYFNGNYLGLDGGRMYTNANTVPLLGNRAFYQSSFSAQYIHSIATNPRNVYGVFYTQHFFGGRLAGMKLFGAIIARDEAIVTDDSGEIYYDPRISKQEPATYINLFLPRTSALSVVAFKQADADDASPASPDW